MKIVNHLSVLKAMEHAGHIKLHPDTGHLVKHWTGPKVTAYYVDHGDITTQFEYKGKQYRLKYFDGCFHPFVVLLDGKPGPSII